MLVLIFRVSTCTARYKSVQRMLAANVMSHVSNIKLDKRQVSSPKANPGFFVDLRDAGLLSARRPVAAATVPKKRRSAVVSTRSQLLDEFLQYIPQTLLHSDRSECS